MYKNKYIYNKYKIKIISLIIFNNNFNNNKKNIYLILIN